MGHKRKKEEAKTGGHKEARVQPGEKRHPGGSVGLLEEKVLDDPKAYACSSIGSFESESKSTGSSKGAALRPRRRLAIRRPGARGVGADSPGVAAKWGGEVR